VSAYRGVERKVAKALESLPWVRNSVKAAYHRVNYLCFREPGFRSGVHPKACLLSAEEWLGAALLPEGGVFFGYYDKSPWSPSMQQLIVHRLRAESAEILVLDRASHACRTVGMSNTWNHQQGCMAQWLPWSAGRSLIFNDSQNGSLVSRIVTTDGEQTLVPLPIQAVHPTAPGALSINYRRLARLRPEYGYAINVKNFAPDQPLDRDGIWYVDLRTGDSWLLFSLAALSESDPHPEMQQSEHKINHAMYSPAGTRFIFLHRWMGRRGGFSRLYVAGEAGTGLRLLLEGRVVSHCTWLDEEHVLVWGRAPEAGDRYYLIDVTTGERSVVAHGSLDIYGDGHPSFSPDRRWLVTDSYPDRARQRHLLLYYCETGQVVEIARFFAPWRFDGASRCDLHPRWSPDGGWICVDSVHTGTRMTYLLDVRAVRARLEAPELWPALAGSGTP
jgi:WD40-like Beta Propeller Repeat